MVFQGDGLEMSIPSSSHRHQSGRAKGLAIEKLSYIKRKKGAWQVQCREGLPQAERNEKEV